MQKKEIKELKKSGMARYKAEKKESSSKGKALSKASGKVVSPHNISCLPEVKSIKKKPPCKY